MTSLSSHSILYGRRKGRPLSGERSAAMEALSSLLSISADLLTEKGDFDPAMLFGAKAPVTLEIGFGNGEHVKALMESAPDEHFLACEPFEAGMAAFFKSIHHTPLRNVRVLMDDAMKLARSLSSESLKAIYVLNPDPWPKKRHHKRRIISAENLDVFARILKPGGSLIMTSDVDDLAEWMVTQASRHPAFHWTATHHKDWQTPPPGWMPTRYETKGIKAGRKQTYLMFKRKP